MQIWWSFYSLFTTLQWFPMAKVQIALQCTKGPLWLRPWVSPPSFLTLDCSPPPNRSPPQLHFSYTELCLPVSFLCLSVHVFLLPNKWWYIFQDPTHMTPFLWHYTDTSPLFPYCFIYPVNKCFSLLTICPFQTHCVKHWMWEAEVGMIPVLVKHTV